MKLFISIGLDENESDKTVTIVDANNNSHVLDAEHASCIIDGPAPTINLDGALYDAHKE